MLAFAGSVLTHEDQVRFLLLGVGSGALIAAVALGVVLTYRGSGVVNFASGALGMYAAYMFNGLRTDGRLVLPPIPNPLAVIEGLDHAFGGSLDLPHIPAFVDFGGPMAVPLAIAVSLAMVGLIGLAFHVLVFRPLRNAPALAKVVASVGLLTLLQAIIVIRYGSTPKSAKSLLTTEPQRLPFDLVIPRDQLLLAAIVVLLAFVLWAVFRFTKFGLATRAAAENEKGAMVLGYSADFLAGANWILSALVVGALGILAAPVNRILDPVTLSLLVVPALGAALLGRLESFGITTAAGIGIGMIQTWIQFLSTKSWFPQAGSGPIPGLREAVPLVVIVVALFLRSKTLPSRGSLELGRLPFAAPPKYVARWVVFCSALSVWGLLFLGPDWRLGIINTLVMTVVFLSLVIITGMVGQISLAHMVLAGVAGFTMSKLVDSWGVPFPLGPLLGAGVAAIFGTIVAIPAMRVRGVNLAIVTMAAGVAIENVVFRNPTWSGGAQGASVPAPSLFGLHFGPNDPGAFKLLRYRGDGLLPNPWFGVFCLVVTIGCVLGVCRLRRSDLGRRMLAVRVNERAAAAAGVDVVRTKLLAFALSAFVAGIGGALSGYRFGAVTPASFGAVASITVLVYAYLGGISTVSGAVFAGIISTNGVQTTVLRMVIDDALVEKYSLLVGAFTLVMMAVMHPDGISGTTRRMLDRIWRGSFLQSLVARAGDWWRAAVAPRLHPRMRFLSLSVDTDEPPSRSLPAEERDFTPVATEALP